MGRRLELKRLKVKNKRGKLLVRRKLRKGEQSSVVELDILLKRNVPALLPPENEITPESRKIEFSLSGQQQTLASLLSQGLTFGSFANIVLNIVDTMQLCESYGMRLGNLELNSELAFVSKENGQDQGIRLIYWPVVTLEDPASVLSFFETLGSECVFPEDDASYEAEYLDIFDTREEFKLEAFRGSVLALLQDWSVAHGLRQESPVASSKEHRGNCGITANLPCSTLLRVKTNEITKVEHFPFTVGRSVDSCTYAIDGNSFVGRIQFSVHERGGEYFLQDEGSINVTSLEGKSLIGGECVRLHSGEVIAVGDEEFVFFSPEGLQARRAV